MALIDAKVAQALHIVGCAVTIVVSAHIEAGLDCG
jgi:hypothetical protein